MPTRPQLLAACLAVGLGPGCGGDDTPADRGGPTGDTATAAPTGVRSASCVEQPGNALRWDCTVSLHAPGPTAVAYREAGTSAWRVHPSATDDTDEHLIVLYDLKGDTDWEWASGLQQEGRSGTFTTSPVPESVNVRFVPPLPVPLASDRLLFPFMCGTQVFMVAVDPVGAVRWYQPTNSLATVTGFDRTDRQTVTTVSARRYLTETGFAGAELVKLDHQAGDVPIVHHDTVTRDGTTLTLTARTEVIGPFTWIVDGVIATDAEGQELWSWDSLQIFDPLTLSGAAPAVGYWAGTFEDALDFGHANSVDLDADGDMIVSFKHLHTVVKVHTADPAAPEFGTLAWALVGSPGAGVESDLVLGSTAGLDTVFEHQHHAQWTDAGTMLLFDNGLDVVQGSRVIEVAIDGSAGTADVVREWDMAGYCPIQSSAWLVGDSLIAACASERRLLQFAPGSSVAEIDTVVDCADEQTLRTALIRAMPTSLPPPQATSVE